MAAFLLGKFRNQAWTEAALDRVRRSRARSTAACDASGNFFLAELSNSGVLMSSSEFF